MNDTLRRVVHAEQPNAVRFGVCLDRFDHGADFRVPDSANPACAVARRNVMIGAGHELIGPPNP